MAANNKSEGIRARAAQPAPAPAENYSQRRRVSAKPAENHDESQLAINSQRPVNSGDGITRFNAKEDGGPVSKFLREYFCHFNAREVVDAADGYIELLNKGGAMFITLAGAASTAELGKCLAEMIRQDKIHGISCTGANLEEDLFNLVGRPLYQELPKYQDLTPQDEEHLREKGMNRVTDSAIPDEEVVNPVSDAVREVWKKAAASGQRYFPHEYLYQVIKSGVLEKDYKADPKDSWLLAAAEKNLLIVVPGWEDSTLGNAFAADCLSYEYEPSLVKSGIEYFMELSDWYESTTKDHNGVGFFQLGGGIAGDFPICVVPMINLELKQKAPLWAYFCQITDAEVSYGGYSGAYPNEKITWGKLDSKTPAFNIKSDFTICFPLIAAMVLGE